MGAISQSQLLEYINALSLAMVDTAEFLDTHPDDSEAPILGDRLYGST